MLGKSYSLDEAFVYSYCYSLAVSLLLTVIYGIYFCSVFIIVKIINNCFSDYDLWNSLYTIWATIQILGSAGEILILLEMAYGKCAMKKLWVSQAIQRRAWQYLQWPQNTRNRCQSGQSLNLSALGSKIVWVTTEELNMNRETDSNRRFGKEKNSLKDGVFNLDWWEEDACFI